MFSLSVCLSISVSVSHSGLCVSLSVTLSISLQAIWGEGEKKRPGIHSMNMGQNIPFTVRIPLRKLNLPRVRDNICRLLLQPYDSGPRKQLCWLVYCVSCRLKATRRFRQLLKTVTYSRSSAVPCIKTTETLKHQLLISIQDTLPRLFFLLNQIAIAHCNPVDCIGVFLLHPPQIMTQYWN